MRRLLAALTTTALGLCAQETEPRTISVQLTRPVNVTPDVAVVIVSMATVQPLSLSEAAAVLQPAGFLEADVIEGMNAAVYTLVEGSPGFVFLSLVSSIRFTFARRLPGGQVHNTLMQLSAIQKNSPSAPIVFVTYNEASQVLLQQAQTRLFPEIIAEARREAEGLATAAGLRVKELAAVHETPSPAPMFAQPFLATSTFIGPGVGGTTYYALLISAPAQKPHAQYTFDFLVE